MTEYILNEDQRKLAEQNLKLVPYALGKLFCTGKISDDLMSVGCIGLCRAAANYDPSKQAVFSTYAVTCIIREVAKELHLAKAKCRWNGVPCLSLNRRAGNDTDSDELIDLLIDQSVDVESEALNRVLCDSVMVDIPTIAHLVAHDLTLRELGEIKHVSKQRIGQLKIAEAKIAKRKLTRGGNDGFIY